MMHKVDVQGFEDYLMEQGYSQKTVASYVKCLRRANQYDELHLALNKRKLSRPYYNLILSSLNKYADCIGGKQGDKILKSLKSLPRRRWKEPEPERPLTDEEWRTLLDSVEEEDPPLQQILILMCRTGLRVGDLGEGIERKKAEEGLKTGTLQVKVKGGKYRPFPVQGHVITALEDLLSFSNWKYLWQSVTKKSTHAYYMAVSRALRRAGNRVDIPASMLHPHLLRKTVAVQALKAAGGNVIEVQKFLGHKDVRTTQRYLAYIEVEELWDLMDKIDQEREQK